VILKHWHRSLAVCLPIALLALSIWSLNRQLHHYRLEEILASLATTANRYLALAAGLTILNYAILTGYDTLAVRYLRHLLPYRAAALVSFVSYAIGNSVGFALLSGSAIRYRFYSRWGFSKTEIAKIIVFCNLSFWVGLLSVGGVMFVKEPIAVPKILHLPFQSVYPLGLIFLTVVTLYLLGGTFGHQFIQVGRWTLPVLPLRLSLAQIAVTSLDWMLVAGVLYALLPAPVPLSYPGFFLWHLSTGPDCWPGEQRAWRSGGVRKRDAPAALSHCVCRRFVWRTVSLSGDLLPCPADFGSFAAGYRRIALPSRPQKSKPVLSAFALTRQPP
jgi:uncharacterized membrane protein YbhN (UPF0104 family)